MERTCSGFRIGGGGGGGTNGGVSEVRGVEIPEGWYDEACGFRQDLTGSHGGLVTKGGEGSGAGG